MAQVNVADKCGLASAPRRRQIRQTYRRPRNPRQAGVDYARDTDSKSCRKKPLRQTMEIQRYAGQSGYGKDRPRTESRGEEECQQPQPDGCRPIEPAQSRIRVAIGKQRRRYKAD